jgi:hypothetical protein
MPDSPRHGAAPWREHVAESSGAPDEARNISGGREVGGAPASGSDEVVDLTSDAAGEDRGQGRGGGVAELALAAVAAFPAVPAAHPGEGVPPAPACAATPPKPSTGKRPREADSDNEDESHDQCIICHEDFNNSGDHKVVSLACGHLFGNCCILKWLGERKACPSCNKKATRRDIRPIFFSRLLLRDRTEEEALQRELEKQRQQRQRAEEALKRRQQDLVKSQVEKKSLEAELKALKQQLKTAQQQWATTAAAAAAAHPPHTSATATTPTTTTAPLAPSSTVPFGIGGGRQQTRKPPPHPFPSSSSSHATVAAASAHGGGIQGKTFSKVFYMVTLYSK